MSLLQYQCTMSLDGFIAGPGGDMQWMNDLEMPPSSLAEGLAEKSAVLLTGARTFDGDDPNAGTDAEGAYGGTFDGSSVVLTHHPVDPPPDGVEFAGDLMEAVERCRELAGDGTVAVLGADVARQCLADRVLDEVLVFVVPILLGDGVRLFDWPGGRTVHLDVIEVSDLALRARVVH